MEKTSRNYQNSTFTFGAKLTIRHGTLLNHKKARESMILLLVVGGILCFDRNSMWIGILLCLFGIAGFTFAYGTQIDLTGQRIRSYSSILLIKSGKWIPLSNFSSIVVSKAPPREREDHDLHYGIWRAYAHPGSAIYLPDQTNEHKMLVEIHPETEMAHQRAFFLSQVLNKPYQQ